MSIWQSSSVGVTSLEWVHFVEFPFVYLLLSSNNSLLLSAYKFETYFDRFIFEFKLEFIYNITLSLAPYFPILFPVKYISSVTYFRLSEFKLKMTVHYLGR